MMSEELGDFAAGRHDVIGLNAGRATRAKHVGRRVEVVGRPA